MFDVEDLDLLIGMINDPSRFDWLEDMYNVNGDTALVENARRCGEPCYPSVVPLIDEKDLHLWIKEVKQTWIGDANLDGAFNSSDLVTVFAAGGYEDTFAVDSGWSEGVWNGDGAFSASDLAAALAGEAPDFESLRAAIRDDPTGRRFFDPSLPWFPEADFDACIALDRFDFAVVARRDERYGLRLEAQAPGQLPPGQSALR